MSDLLSAFNGAIPVGALRSKQLHNRVNKLVIEKKKPAPIIQGGESIVVEKIEDFPPSAREEKKEEVYSGPGPRGQEKIFPWRGTQEEQPKEKSLDNTTSEMVKIDTIQEEVNVQKPKKKTKRKYTKRKSNK